MFTSSTKKVASPQRSHPRRPPTHLSVNLRHDAAAPDARAGNVRGDATQASPEKQASDESNDSVEGAEKWFDLSNQRPGPGLGFPQMEDNEPPYFLPHNGSDNSNDDYDDRTLLQPRQAGLGSRVFQSATNSSSICDYRSVIDDLTIENQKLRQKVRKLSRAPHPRLEKDKLFEVRIHALPPRKRRELEDFLRSFASSVNDDSADEKNTVPKVLHPYSSLDHSEKPKAKHSSPSATSTSRPVDSAYASFSNSGPTSSFLPNDVALGEKSSQPRVGKEQNIHSFLYNIPEGLLPQKSPVMTERQKKKLVVQRLEQLFTGKKGALVGEHSQPLQQQEVSRSAEKADRAANDGVAPAEGFREAYMRPYASDETPAKPYVSDTSDEASPVDFSPDQRPTRPLDLDPDRAQVPSENIEYIRHLGLSTPNFNSETSSDSVTAADANGWIYLNLLINMAQLHILNVTTDFVREALADVSERFQVSRDGKKIKWKGGTQGTRLSSDSDASTEAHQTTDDSDSLEERKRKRRKVNARNFAPIPVQASNTALSQNYPDQSLHYRPLFQHGNSSGGLFSSDESDFLSSYSAKNDKRPARSINPETWKNASNRKSSKEKRDAGLLVFYNNATFCTDLSGDRGGTSTPLDIYAADQDVFFYGGRSENSKKDAPTFPRTPSGSLLPYRPFKDYSKQTSDLLQTETNRPETPGLLSGDPEDGFFVNAKADDSNMPNQLQTFVSSGIGGTRPADHFSVSVKTRRIMVDIYNPSKFSQFSTSGYRSRRFAHLTPRSSLESFFRQDSAESQQNNAPSAVHPSQLPLAKDLPIKTEIVSSRLQEHEPSELPPPLGYYAGYSSSEADSNLSNSLSHASDSRRTKSFRQQKMSDTSTSRAEAYFPLVSPFAYEDGKSSDEDVDEDGDGSIDMLAEARRLDPETIAAKELEFEMGG